MQTNQSRDYARLLLAAIRMFNGVVGLLAPQFIIKRFAADDPESKATMAATYALRMFGIRTILLAIDLVRPTGPERSHAIRFAPVIHASDLVTAVLIAKSGKVAMKTGLMIVMISGLNTLLSFIMRDDATPVEGA